MRHFPVLPWFFGKMARKTTKQTRIFYPCRTPKIPGKEGKNAPKKQRIPRTGKKQGIPKKQGKEGEGHFIECFRGGVTEGLAILFNVSEEDVGGAQWLREN